MNKKIQMREELEWANFWYDDANEEKKDRVLLIGDSTARMIRKKLHERLKLPVDLFATSASYESVLFWKQLDAFLDKYTYNTVFIQIGIHGDKNALTEFEEGLLKLISIIRRYTAKVVLLTIFYAVIPPIEPKRVDNIIMQGVRFLILLMIPKKFERFDESLCEITEKKNRIIKKVGESSGISVCDIATLMKMSKYKHIDTNHFERKAFLPIVNEYIKYIEY